jgi:hypothetical protein
MLSMRSGTDVEAVKMSHLIFRPFVAVITLERVMFLFSCSRCIMVRYMAMSLSTLWRSMAKVQQAGEGRLKSVSPIRMVVAVLQRVTGGLRGASWISVACPKGLVSVACGRPAGLAEVVEIERPSLDFWVFVDANF